VTPDTVGRYRLLTPLGGTPEQRVYQAVAQDTNQPVALKLIALDSLPNYKARGRFLEEARSSTRLTHPGLRRIYEVGRQDDHVYLVMEYLEGAPLRSLLLAGPVAVETALAWGAEMAEALAAAHAKRLAQGQLGTTKVFITSQGTVKLLDTGLWRAAIPVGTDLTREEQLVEKLDPTTVAVLAPEQLRGQLPDARSDIFALGTLIYEMVAGLSPFADPSPRQAMHWVLERTPAPVSEFRREASVALDGILEQAMAKQAKERFKSASEFSRALSKVARHEPQPFSPMIESEAEPVAGSRPLLWVGIGAVLLLLALGVAYLTWVRP
jgi:serine/threonine-protein kinase